MATYTTICNLKTNSPRGLAQARNMLRGLEKFTHMGRIFADPLWEGLESYYLDEVVDIMEKHKDNTKYFWVLVEKVEEALEEAEADKKKQENKFPKDITTTDDFISWYGNQTVAYVEKKLREEQRSFWEKWELPTNGKRALRNLTEVEERVLFLREGLDSGEKRKAEDIAGLPEFQCKPDYIVSVFRMLDEKIRYRDRGMDTVFEEFEKCRKNVKDGTLNIATEKN